MFFRRVAFQNVRRKTARTYSLEIVMKKTWEVMVSVSKNLLISNVAMHDSLSDVINGYKFGKINYGTFRMS